MAAAVGAVVLQPSAPGAGTSTATAMTLVVLPHADDEFQVWSLLEDRPESYTVFLLATRSEQTGFCDPTEYAAVGHQPGLEEPAVPEPRGRWTESCEQARRSSLTGYLADMSAADPSVPGRLVDAGTVGPLPSDGVEICRRDTLADADSARCTPEDVVDTTARVLLDEAGRGAVVELNLGDGDLTAEEVIWAVRTVLENRAELGLDADLPVEQVLAAYANTDPACFVYAHRDHLAVRDALRGTDVGVPRRAGATCATDPDASLAASVSDSSADAAWRLGPGGERLGAHVSNYGWLYGPYYPLDREGQAELFHTSQHFWVQEAPWPTAQ